MALGRDAVPHGLRSSSSTGAPSRPARVGRDLQAAQILNCTALGKWFAERPSFRRRSRRDTRVLPSSVLGCFSAGQCCYCGLRQQHTAGPKSQIGVPGECIRTAVGNANGHVSNSQLARKLLRLSQVLEGGRRSGVLCWDSEIADRQCGGERKGQADMTWSTREWRTCGNSVLVIT